MKSRRRFVAALPIVALVSACVTQVELARSAPDELLIVGPVSDRVIERFASEPGGERDEALLSLTYPAEGTELPENLGAMRFAWHFDTKAAPPKPEPAPMMKAKGDPPADDNTFFELCLDAGPQTLCAYTDATEVDIAATHWARLMAARRGGEIRVHLRGLLSKEDRVLATTERTLAVSSPVASGTIYYLAQDRAQLQRTTISSESPSPIALPTAAPAASFAISRDGKRLAFMPTADVLQVLSLPGLEMLWSISAPLSGPASAAIAFDPTARRIAYARAGTLVLIDADDGTVLPSVSAPGSARVSHPDWSPDGRHLAVTLWPTDAMPDEMALEGTGLARLSVAIDGSLGAPEPLLASSKRDETLAFPVHSRDGEWLAYLQFKGKLHDGKEGELWVINAAGGAPTLLSDASAMMPKDEALTLAPAPPSWLPSESPELEWLAFSAQGLFTMKASQLWLAKVHKAQLGVGAVAGHALWLPFQNAASANLWPVFAQD